MPLRATYASQMNDPFLAANTIASFTGPQNLIKTTGNAAYVAQPCIIPANYLKPGTTIRTEAFGSFTNASTTPTLVLGTYYAAVALAVNVALTETSVASVQLPWHFRTITHVRSAAVPTAVVVITQGELWYGTSLTATTQIPVPGIALATVNIDNSAAAEWSVQATLGTSAAGNTVTLHGLTIEELTQI